MWKGSVISLQIASGEGQPLTHTDQAHAVPGRGIEGDRYYLGTGHFSKMGKASYEITLIESEALEALKRDYGCELTPLTARRNIVTVGVPLNHLVWKAFKVGEVTLLGRRLCEPCFHLVQLTKPDALSGLLHRGGLRAQILTEGIIRPGDPIQVAEDQSIALAYKAEQAAKEALEPAI
ncbi:MOSC domain-containing protein [Dictyobacter aurantiacus]|uniref:Molybdenum cofactor biosysynthesis protein n=1 Tax=Dictyobacter aurantiacus TaxID=1936993 RepID=A0A401ZDX9_9CHLR|nr:MOSC domain-containing protein [Dictyobacter aurantiacus]GCE05043.1 molybdenum cofactor biosysynthesis protein [Dictyobacter aurantiacus]